MKVQLIQPTTGEYRSNSRSGCYPPLGLISIATYIRQECPSVKVEILDGELISDDEIIARLDSDIVGLNTNTVTYPQAIKIAAAAKKRGSKVVLGGVYASAIPDIILSKRAYLIDSLIINQNHEFNSLPYPDRSLVDLDEYVQIFQQNHPTWKYRGTSIFTNVGCTWREKSGGGCIFCSRSGARTGKKHPSIIWQEVRELVENYRIDYLVDFSDTILQDTGWLQSVIKAKPKDINPSWHIFARMDEINPETLKLVKQLPCNHIFVGIESGDPQIYRAARKGGGSPEDSLKAAKLLKDFGIELTPSYVIGLPGETEESLKRTYDHACRLKELTSFEEIFCCQLIPFPGSRAFDLLRTKTNIDADILDIEYLKKLWADHFCPIDFELMHEYAHKILGLGKYKITIAKNVRRAEIVGSSKEKDAVSIVPCERGGAAEFYSCV
ncbi:MAG: radical SAM protein [Deltaproteobacteria bacterium]|nr:radical SAM protein [Deltaproteobacteria bacterium]